MKKMKWLIVALALLLLLSGCNIVQVNPERDAQTVVAKVQDEVITKGEFLQQYEIVKYYNRITEAVENDPTYKEYIDDLKNSTMDMLVEEKITLIKARELNCYDLSEDQRNELETEKNDSLDYYKQAYLNQLKEEEGNKDKSDEELDQMAEEGLDDYINGLGIDVEGQFKSLEDQMAQENLYEKVTDLPPPSETELLAIYDQKLQEQKTGFTDGSLSYEQMIQEQEIICYNPENARKAQHILIILQQAEIDAIGQMRQSDDEGADQLRAAALGTIQEAADAAYERAAAGEDFKALIDELGEDPGMESNEYYVVLKDSVMFVPEFAEGLFSLENVGDITEPVGTDYGYHIIKYYEEIPAGQVDFKEVRDVIHTEVHTENKNNFFSQKLNEWRDDLNVKVYMDRIG